MKNKPKYHIPYTIYIVLFSLALLERTVFDLGPNIEILTSALILSSFYFGAKKSFLGVLTVMILSDLIIGNTNIYIFTWSGFLIPVLLVSPLIKNLSTKYHILNTKLTPLTLTVTSLSANLFFYIYTNLGVWLLDSWGMYTKDFQGLIHCYINALPFLKNQMVSSLIFVPLGFTLVNFISRTLSYIQVRPLTILKTLP